MEPGTVVAGRYRLQALAGKGAFANVHRAHDLDSGATVALKVLRDFAPSGRATFEREAALLAGLTHPRIVKLLDCGDSGHGFYLALEWLEGETLHQRLKRGELSAAEAVAVARGVAEALAVAHEAGVVHRDVKPGNLFLVDGRTDDVRLLDFGIARLVRTSVRITATGNLVGTPGYMAPEQARSDATVDARADVFGLGCVVFRALAGVPPFHGEHVTAVLAKVLLETAPRLRDKVRDAPPELDELLAEMLAKDPDARPRDGRALLARLATLSLAPRTGGAGAALGSDEQRLSSIVMIETSEEGARGEDATQIDPPAQPEAALVRGGQDTALELVRRAVAPFGVGVERLADGVILVAFTGAMRASDRAAQAARAALSIVSALPSAKVALATGHARVGEGSLSRAEVIDRATATLASARAPGEVWLDRLTERLLAPEFEVIATADGALLRRERDVRPPPSLLGKPSPCVGRARELDMLLSLFEQCAEERAPKAALITGEAGVGKSRLGYELAQRLRGRASIWTARSDPMSQGSLFGLIPQLVKRAEVPAPAILVGIGEEIEGASKDPRVRAEQMRRAWAELVRASSEERPLVMLLEDLHWADPASVRLVEVALLSAESSPALVIAFARPEIRDVFPRLFVELGLAHVSLRELGREAMEALVRAALPDATPELTRSLCERAQGNPLFLEELIRGAAEGREELPATVVAMVEHRIAELDASSRQALRAASVLGATFERAGLRALLGEDHGEALAILEADELVSRAGAGYAFRYDVIREAAYATLTPSDRILGHKLAGEWLASLQGADVARVAEHFERAGEHARAAPFLARAAERALHANDLASAIELAERALSVGLEGEGEAWLVLAEARLFRGEMEESGACAARALAALEPRGRPWFTALGEVVVASARRGSVDEAALAELAREAEGGAEDVRLAAAARASIHLCVAGRDADADRLLSSAARGSSDPGTAAAILAARGFRSLQRHDLLACKVEHERAAELFERAGDLRRACNAQTNVGFACMHLGAYELAERWLRGALPRAKKMGLDQVEAMIHHNLGFVLGELGRFEEAIAVEIVARDTFAARSDTRMTGGAWIYLARIHLRAGRLTRARAAAEEAALALAEIPSLLCYALAVKALVALEQDDVASAHQATARATGILRELGEVEEGEALVRLADAEVLRRAGFHEGARLAIRALADDIDARARSIADPELARSFRERVPEHVRALELAREW